MQGFTVTTPAPITATTTTTTTDEDNALFVRLAALESQLHQRMVSLSTLVAPTTQLHEGMAAVREDMLVLETEIQHAEVVFATRPLMVEVRELVCQNTKQQLIIVMCLATCKRETSDTQGGSESASNATASTETTTATEYGQTSSH